MGDLEKILALQKEAYISEAGLVGDYFIKPLVQTLEEMTEEFKKGLFLKAVEDGKIVGSVRAQKRGGKVYISKLMVSPALWGQGIGTRLLEAVEQRFPLLNKELYTSEKSVRNIALYKRNGYYETRRENMGNYDMVFLEKDAAPKI